jgi:hypothetical protein
MGLQQNPLNEDNIISIIDQFLSRDTDPEQKVLFAQRKVEFLEDFGNDILRYVIVFLLLSTLLVKITWPVHSYITENNWQDKKHIYSWEISVM